MAPQNDPYIDAASGVLKNKLGLTDPRELSKAEAARAAEQSRKLDRNPVKGNFDLKHLQAIHKHLFGKVYEWAGQIRQIDIFKGQSTFAHYGRIESAAAKVFKNLANEKHLKGLSKQEFSARAAHYLAEINVLHPFREGNGRTQRAFMTQLARESGYDIAWKNITREEMTQASLEAFHDEPRQLAALIDKNLETFDQSRDFDQQLFAEEFSRLQSHEAAQQDLGDPDIGRDF